MAAIQLFNRTETIIRTTSEGYYDANEEFVAGATVNIPIECNIQPYREGLNAFNEPTGIRTINAIVIYTPSTLQASDEERGIVGDQLTYKNQSYFCKDLEQWDGQMGAVTSLIPVHNVGYFYRKDDK